MSCGDLDARLLAVAQASVDKRALGEAYEVAITRQLDQVAEGTLARTHVIVACDDPSAIGRKVRLDAYVTIFLCVPPDEAIDGAVAACLENLVKQKHAKLSVGNGKALPSGLFIPGGN